MAHKQGTQSVAICAPSESASARIQTLPNRSGKIVAARLDTNSHRDVVNFL